MSDAKDSCLICEEVALYPVRFALANRIGKKGKDCFPDYWPADLKNDSTAPKIPHWGYACRLLRPAGWVYIYHSNILYEYSATNRGFKLTRGCRQQNGVLEFLPVGSGFKPAIYVPKHTVGKIAYSENIWGSTRFKQMLIDGKARAQRMRHFNTNAPDRRMLPFSPTNWNIVEEMREIPNGVVCMGVELGLNPNSRYEQLCYHGLRNISLLRLQSTDLLQWNSYRRNLIRQAKLGLEVESEHCIPLETKKLLPPKFPHHISWHAVNTVSPFVWLWQKKSDDSEVAYELSPMGKSLVALTCGYIIVLDDPVGICRELSALCDTAHEDEDLYWESIHYPYTIAQYIQSLIKTGVAESMLKYLRLSKLEIFLKTVCTGTTQMAAYLDDITAAREIWMHSNTSCKLHLQECFKDLPLDDEAQLCIRECMLGALLSNFTHCDKGKKLADEMFMNTEDKESLLWSTVSLTTAGAVPFPETTGTAAILFGLWRFFLPTDTATLAARIKALRTWLQGLNDRGIIPMVEKLFSDAELYQWSKHLQGQDEASQSDEDYAWATLVYPYAQEDSGLPNPVAPYMASCHATLRLQPRVLSLTPQYNLYVPKSIEAAAAVGDLKLDPISTPLRMFVTALTAQAVLAVVLKKDPSMLDKVGAVVGTLAALTGLVEWKTYYSSLVRAREFSGFANKALGGLLGFLVTVDTGIGAINAICEERYAQGVQLAGMSIASSMIGYSSLAKALQTASQIPDKAKLSGLRTLAGHAFKLLPWGKAGARLALGPWAIGIFAVADVYTLYTETTDPLNIWGKKCVFSNLSEYISLEKLCATTPLYSRLSGLPSPSPAERLEKEHEELFKALYAPSLRLRAPLPRIRNTPDASIINCHLPAGPTISLRAELPGAENEDCRLWLWWEFTNPYSKSRQREGVLVASLLPLSTSAETRDFEITLKLPSSLLSDLDVQPLHYVYEVRNPALGSLSSRRATFTGPVEN